MRFAIAYLRLVSCVVIGVVTVLWLPATVAMETITKIIIGWKVGACLYPVLVFVVTAALMCIGAIVAELAVVQEFQCPPRYAYMALAGLHDCFIMTFTQIMFAL